jgi:hypothetical protein
VLSEEFNPQNTMCILPVKFFFRLELEQTKQFSNSRLKKNATRLMGIIFPLGLRGTNLTRQHYCRICEYVRRELQPTDPKICIRNDINCQVKLDLCKNTLFIWFWSLWQKL